MRNLPFTPEEALCTEGGVGALTFRIWTADVQDHVPNLSIESADTNDGAA